MSKKSRSERRKAQRQRAVRAGDPDALAALAQRSADAGARAILQAIGSTPAAASDPALVELAASVCERLRADDAFDTALKLSSAFGRATPRLCLEESLAAFALGDDARALDAASAHREVQQALAPVLAVAREGRVPNTPAGAPAQLRALIALARSVSALRTGRSANALAALRQVPDELAGPLFVKEMRAAVDVVAGRSTKLESASRSLVTSSVVRRNQRVAAALAQCVATRAPKLFIESIASSIPLAESAKAEAMLQASMAAAGLDTDEGRVSLLIAKLGHAAFPADQQGAAALFEGFAYVAADPERAQKAFDRAVALGADMGEALRGRFLAQRSHYQQTAGMLDRTSARARGRAAASTAMRLHAALSHVPGAGALAVTAALAAAEILYHGEDSERLLEAIRAVRASASSAGLLSAKLEAQALFYEADTVPRHRPERALELIDKALEHDPKHHQAWHLRIMLTGLVKGEAAQEDRVLEAADLEICPEIVAQAREIRIRRGLPVPWSPGKARAGEIAAELARRVRRDGAAGRTEPYDADLLACRTALSTADRRALDVAALVVLRQNGHQQAVPSLLRLVAADGRDSRDALSVSAVAAAAMGWNDTVAEVAKAAATPEGVRDVALSALAFYRHAGQSDAAQKLVLAVASVVSSSGLRSLRNALRGGYGATGIRAQALDLLDDAMRALEPAYRFPPPIVGAIGAGDADDGLPDLGGALPPVKTGADFLRGLPIPGEVLQSISQSELQAIGAELARLTRGKANLKSAKRVIELLARLGLPLDELLDTLELS